MAKKVLITGASRGIGKAAALAFSNAGFELYLTCRHSEAALQALFSQITSEQNKNQKAPELFIGDIGDPQFVFEMFTHISDLDILINNAGVAHIGLLHEMSVAEWNAVLNTNLNAAFYTARHAIPLFLKKHAGKILNVSSVWGNVGASMEVAYSASKGGLNAMTKALAKELAPSNIQVNALACGVIDTDMNRCFDEADMESLIAEIPADRLGKPEEAAAMLLQLATAPSYLTGQIITLDGGWI
ncbi:MAG: SDR family NAD(P)-dependent oxidoreductase [Lachnospiraceae bacterium]|nr:SDR family NAD(P)-dependent oxidoreductase [Lachnospiraceae bacterium]